MEAAQIEKWSRDFRAKSKIVDTSSTDTSGEIPFAIDVLQHALPQLCATPELAAVTTCQRYQHGQHGAMFMLAQGLSHTRDLFSRAGASPRDQKSFLTALQGLRNIAVVSLLVASSELPELASSIIEHAARMTISSSLMAAQPILKVVSQLLANLANGQLTRNAVVQTCWPDALLKIALANAPDAHEAACQTIYNCCRDDMDFSGQVCSTGGRFMVRMLRNCLQLQHEATNAALALLLGHLTCTCGHLQTLLASVHDVLASEAALEAVGGAAQDSCTIPVDCSEYDDNGGRNRCSGDTDSSSEEMDTDCIVHTPRVSEGACGSLEVLVRSSETSCLLHLLTHEISVSAAVLLGSTVAESSAVMQCLVELLRSCLGACADKKEHLAAQDASSCREELEDRIGRGYRCCAALVLEACLRFFATLLSRDELTQHGQDVKGLLSCGLGLPSMLLGALACLPKLVAPTAAAGAAVGANSATQNAQVPGQGLQGFQAPLAVPYPGYRSDLLAVIGNLAHAHTASQDAIAQDGGLELILAQSHFSPTEPVVREWALWAVRNMCISNAGVQDRVRNLQLHTTVQDELLQQRHQQVELDQLTGKLNLVDLGR